MLVALGMLVGLVGTLFPFIPGLPIVWAAALAYGLGAGFGSIGTVAFSIISVLAVAGMVAAFALPHRRVAATGVPRSTVMAGVAGAVIGFFVIPVVGLVIGAIAAVMMAEYARTSDASVAWRGTKTLVVGFGLGVLLELATGIAMVGIWVVWVLLD